jgi:hypothetical protein
MRTWTRILLMVAVGACLAGGSYAVPPAYEGPMGNCEDPAFEIGTGIWGA